MNELMVRDLWRKKLVPETCQSEHGISVALHHWRI